MSKGQPFEAAVPTDTMIAVKLDTLSSITRSGRLGVLLSLARGPYHRLAFVAREAALCSLSLSKKRFAKKKVRVVLLEPPGVSQSNTWRHASVLIHRVSAAPNEEGAETWISWKWSDG
jgi:hypothetical protein